MTVSMKAAMNAYNNAAKIDGLASGITDKIGQPKQPTGAGFSGLVKDTVATTSSALGGAEKTTVSALTKQADITDVVTAVTQAEMTLKTVVAVRDRFVSALQEIMRMPI